MLEFGFIGLLLVFFATLLLCCLPLPLGLVSSLVQAKRLAGKNVSEMIDFASSGT